MSVIFLLITVSTLMAAVFLAAFIRAVRNGQFDDDRSPAVRILMDDGISMPVRKQATDTTRPDTTTSAKSATP